MNIEELKIHVKKPLWRIIKIAYQITNAIIVLVLLSLTTVLIAYTPKCLPLPQYEWFALKIIL